jgi:hypothetical protein
MAQRTHVVLISDLSGKEIADKDGQTVSLTVQGTSYELDLTSKEAKELFKVLEPYTAVARKSGGRRSGSGRSTARGADREQLRNMRQWLRDNGHNVSDRGRISAELQDLYHAAN